MKPTDGSHAKKERIGTVSAVRRFDGIARRKPHCGMHCQGTAVELAQQCGIKQVVCVECGQHESRAAVDTAKHCIQHFAGGLRAPCAPPRAVTIVGAEFVRPGFR